MGIAKNRAERIGSTVVQIGSTKLVPNADNDIEVKDTSNNRKKVIASELRVGTGNDIVIIKRDSSTGKAKFETSSDGGGSTAAQNLGGSSVYTNPSDLPITGNTAGDMAFVTSTNNLMIHNGSGWYKVATVTNATPTISSAGDASYSFLTDGTAVSIEVTASDPEGVALQYKYTVSSGSVGSTATITSSSTSGGTYSALNANTLTTNKYFKVTPSTNEAHAGTFSLTFSAYDGINTGSSTASSFTLGFDVPGSLIFDGTSDKITVEDSDDWHFGTGDFTIEAWIYSNSFANGFNAIVGQWPSNGANANNSFVWETVGTELDFYTLHGGTTITSHLGGITLSLYTWYHVVVQRSGGTVKQYINGVEDFSVSNSNNFNNVSQPLTIGGGVTSLTGGTWNGYISNLRLVKGSAVYTPGSTGNSTYFDGTGDYLSIPKSADLEFGSGDFTIEMFAKYTGSTFPSYTCLYSQSYPIQFYLVSGKPYVFFSDAGDSPSYYAPLDANSAITGYNGTSVVKDTFYHYAITRSGNTFRLFINGYQAATSTSGTALGTPSSIGVSIGDYASSGLYEWTGNISNVRVIKGTALYTSNFTAPTAPLTDVTNTKLLTCQNSSGSITDASTSNHTITAHANAAANAAGPFGAFTVPTDALTAVSNTKLLLSTNNVINVTNGSILFDTNTENLLIADHADFAFGSGDWTIDFWFYFLAAPGSNNWFCNVGVDNSDSIQIYYLHSSNSLSFWDNGGGGTGGMVLTNFGSEVGQWHHIRFCRHGNNHYIFLNGNCTDTSGNIITTGQTWTRSYTHAPATNKLRIAGYGSGSYGWDTPGMLLSDFRIVKGTAVSQSAAKFALPSSPSTAVSGTVLLCAQGDSGLLTDNSGTSKNLTIGEGAPTVDARKVQLPVSDISGNNVGLTFGGDVAFSYVTPFVDNKGGSVFLDGNSDYIQFPDSTDHELGNVNFTIEAWVYQLNSAASDSHHIINKWSNSGTNKEYILRIAESSGNKLQFLYTNNGSTNIIITGNDVILNNTWTHVAVQATSLTVTLYVNGIAQYSTGAQGAIYAGTEGVGIGAQTNAGSPSQYFDGYISNARIVKGSNVYTPSTGSGGSTLFDASSEDLLIEHADMSLGTSDWTIDLWFKLSGNTSGGTYLLWFGPSNGTDNTESIHVYFPSHRHLVFYDFAGGGGYGVMPIPTNNIWYHVRYCRHGLNHYQFLNGNCYEDWDRGGSGSSTSGDIITTGASWIATSNYDHAPASNDSLRIGGGYSGGYGFGNGVRISNVRIIKGTALNTSPAPFSVPQSPLTAVANTKLLTCQNSSGDPTVDNSGTSKTISIANGSPTVDANNPFIGHFVVPTSKLTNVTNTKLLTANDSNIINDASTGNHTATKYHSTVATKFHPFS
jgi:hypothetical protein